MSITANARRAQKTEKVWTDEEVDLIPKNDSLEHSFTIPGVDGNPGITGFGMDHSDFIKRRVLTMDVIKGLDFSDSVFIPFFLTKKIFYGCKFDRCHFFNYNFALCEAYKCSFRESKFEYGSTGFTKIGYCDFEDTFFDPNWVCGTKFVGPIRLSEESILTHHDGMIDAGVDKDDVDKAINQLYQWRDEFEKGMDDESNA